MLEAEDVRKIKFKEFWTKESSWLNQPKTSLENIKANRSQQFEEEKRGMKAVLTSAVLTKELIQHHMLE